MDRLLPALLLLAAPALAGPFDQPWVLVTSEYRPSTDTALRPLVVSDVDGEPAARNRVVTTPGTRRVTVDLPPRKGQSLGTRETIELQASPCMRYDLAARLDSSGRWKPVVRASGTIGECLTKFKGGTVAR